MNFASAKKFILEKLKKELPPQFTYHNFDHVTDVYTAAERLGASEGMDDAEMRLLLTAALFHDSGFVVGPTAHEEGSCRIAAKILPEFGYTEKDIEAISGMIMATKLPQSPQNRLEEIIADADLDYLGRDDFFPISEQLFTEFLATGIVKDYNDWNKLQIRFFESHHYFTNSAKKSRNAKKAENLEMIKTKIQ